MWQWNSHLPELSATKAISVVWSVVGDCACP
jgi:hypothetical protein